MSSWNGCKKVILSVNQKDSHVLILQDDIKPCKNLVRTAEKLIKILPEFPISLFSANEIVQQCKKEGKHWATTDVWFGMPAYILPMDLARYFVSWSEQYLKDDIRADDIRMATFLFQHRLKTFITAPSLVEHDCWETSTMSKGKFGKQHRVTQWFIGEDDPLKIDWSKDLTTPVEEQTARWHEFVRKYKDPNLCRRR